MRNGLVATIQRCLREPLLHFVAAGFALFVTYDGLHGPSQNKESRRIEVSAGDIHRIEVSWQARWQRKPTQAEMHGLIEEHVKEEILYREALALGLERDDTIVRRRLAQKMDFVTEDVSALREPAAGEVETWFAQNADRFASPAFATFRHLFFALDKRGEAAQAQARKALEGLAGGQARGGDAFMFQSAYAEQTQEQVARVFGARFAGSLFQQTAGGWRGPLESGYGWHLVWIESLTPSETPPFETVAAQAKVEWISEQRTKAKRATFETLRARYDIVVTGPDTARGNLAAAVEVR